MSSTDASYTVAVVGAGIIGRTLAYELSKEGYRLSLFDGSNAAGSSSCAYAGAGMLAPYSELERSDELILQLGRDALTLWSDIIKTLPIPVFMQKAGTLVVAHNQDRVFLERFQRHLRKGGPHASLIEGSSLIDSSSSWLRQLEVDELARCEPCLVPRFNNALWLPLEGQIDNRQLLQGLHSGLEKQGVKCCFDSYAGSVKSQELEIAGDRLHFDLVIDCRGVGARADISDLRGVRGEIIDVVAPSVRLSRPVRLMHPRYPIYIVPRQEHHFLIGATSIESESTVPITVHSALELLSAAYSVDSGFAEGYIHEFRVSCRPALSDNLPRIFHQPGLIRVNGLYRHGFLITPTLVRLIIELIKSGRPDDSFANLFISEVSEEALCGAHIS